MLTLLPKWKKSRPEQLDPRRAAPYRLRDDPNLAKLRTLSPLPHDDESNRDRLEPNRATPYSEHDDPKRASERTESADPK
jgi:hypothetical protein